jgi:hypothetical protein
MEVGSKVLITWGKYEGSKGFITTLEGKNVTVKLDKGFELALSIDHIVSDDNRKDDTRYSFPLDSVKKEVNNTVYEVGTFNNGYVALATNTKTGYRLPAKHRYFTTESKVIEYVNSLTSKVKKTKIVADPYKEALKEAEALNNKYKLICMEIEPTAGVKNLEDLIFQAEYVRDAVEGGDDYNDDLEALRDEGKTEGQIKRMQINAIKALTKFIEKYNK